MFSNVLENIYIKKKINQVYFSNIKACKND